MDRSRPACHLFHVILDLGGVLLHHSPYQLVSALALLRAQADAFPFCCPNLSRDKSAEMANQWGWLDDLVLFVRTADDDAEPFSSDSATVPSDGPVAFYIGVLISCLARTSLQCHCPCFGLCDDDDGGGPGGPVRPRTESDPPVPPACAARLLLASLASWLRRYFVKSGN